jgi:flagellar P-ring protein precursor FlgI
MQGVRTNQLLGYGLVVGLDGSGDQTTQAPFTAQSVNSMLSQLGIQLPPGVTPQLRNSAAVMVTTQLPAYARPGQPIDVTVSSLGNAKSLRGGTLLLTPLRRRRSDDRPGQRDRRWRRRRPRGSDQSLSAGRVPGGRRAAVASPALTADRAAGLTQTDFTLAGKVAAAINKSLGTEGAPPLAQALDARVIEVQLPPEADKKVPFLALLENVDVTQDLPSPKVVVNARTGSVVMNQTVTLAPSAVAHGNLSVTICRRRSSPSPALSLRSDVVAEKRISRSSRTGGPSSSWKAGPSSPLW